MEVTKGEQEPLIKPDPQDFSKVDVGEGVGEAQEHAWDGGLCCIFGRNCDSPGVLSCVAVHFVPCMAWGFNLKRAFKHSMLLHATLYFLLLMGSGYLMLGANHAEDRLCPHGPADEASAYARMAGPDEDVHSHRKLLLVHRRLAEDGIEISGADPSTAAAAMFEAADENEDDEAALMEVLDADEIEDLAEAKEEEEEEERERRHKKRADNDEDDDDADKEDEGDDEDEEEHHKPKHGHHKKHRHEEEHDEDDDEDEEHERHHDHHKEHHSKEHHGEKKGPGCHKHKPHPPPPEPPVPWGELPQECRRAIVAKHATLAWALLCSLLGIAYCAAHRTQLREKFGITGSRMGDFCTWMWCSPCALCQETRTLWANNVHEGVWHGRPQQQPPLLLPATSPPPAQAVTGTPVVPKTV